MTIAKNDARQGVIAAKVDFTLADVVAGVVEAIQIPQGAIILSGLLVIDLAFDGETTNTIDVGDSATGDRYLDGTNVGTAGATPLVPTGHEYGAQDEITLTYASTGAAPTEGAGTLYVTYIAANRSQFTQG